VLRRDFPFLKRQIEGFRFRVIVCTSATVDREVSRSLDVNVVANGKLARLNWKVGTANTARGSIGVVAWNIPLKRATGLKAEGERELGSLFGSHLKRIGIDLS
jgi:hypothetical protein